MTASVAGLQQPGKSPIGAFAERLTSPHIHSLRHGLQHQFHSHSMYSLRS